MNLRCPKCGYEWKIDELPDNYRHAFVVCPLCKLSGFIKDFISKSR